MNKIVTTLIIMISPLFVNAKDISISINKLKQIFEKKCTNSIKNETTGIFSKIVIKNQPICKFEYVEANHLQSKNSNLNSLSNKIELLKDEIKKLTEEQIKLKNKNNGLSELKEELKNKKNSLIKQSLDKKNGRLSKFKEELKNQNIKNSLIKKIIESMKQDISNQNQDSKAILNKWSNQLTKNSNKIQNIESNITNLSNQIESFSNKVDKIEKTTQENKNFISIYLEKINEHFIGIAMREGFNKKIFMYGIQFEGYNKNDNSSIFGKLSKGFLKNTTKYTTLNGIKDNEIIDKKSIYSLNIGYRKYFKPNFYKIHPTIGVSSGYILGEENSFIAKAFIGLEYQFKSDKVLIEIGEEYFNSLSYNKVSFNPIGKSTNKLKYHEQFDNFISLKYLWRW